METVVVEDYAVVVEVVENIAEVTGLDLETIPADDTAVVEEVDGRVAEMTGGDTGVDA